MFPSILLAGVVAVSGVYAAIPSVRDLMTAVIVILVVVGIGVLVWQRSRRSDTSLAHRTGLVLDGLSDAGFVTLHDLWLDRQRLDYVVIGAPGVFVVRTEPITTGIIRRDRHDGQVSDVLTELHEDARCLGSHLKPPVKPLLVTAEDLDVEVPHKGALVSLGRLEEFLRNESPRLDEPTVRDTLTQVLLAATARPAAEDEETRHGMYFAR